jgi:hypothetical protein
MNFYDALVSQSTPVEVEPSETSYFAPSAAGLDPRLFRDSKLVPAVRSAVLRILFEHLKKIACQPVCN